MSRPHLLDECNKNCKFPWFLLMIQSQQNFVLKKEKEKGFNTNWEKVMILIFTSWLNWFE